MAKKQLPNQENLLQNSFPFLQKANASIGVLKGKIKIADDFDDPLSDDILNSFEGRL